jgi:PEP-CTERM/exosortase A-associated glycosyltransferase
VPSESRRGKILHVLDHSAPISDGYAFRSAEIIRFQRRAGWDTVHLTSPKQGAAQHERETAEGLEFYRTAPASALERAVPLLQQWAVVARLRRRLQTIVHREAPDVLHVHSPCLNGVAALPVARRYRLPIVYEVRSLWEDAATDSGVCREGDLRYRLTRGLETYVCKRVDTVVTICEGLRAEIGSRGIPASRIRVAPNSVDLERFTSRGARDEALAHLMGLSRGKTFGFIGTFFPFEGLAVLLGAVPLILQEEPRARVVLVGDGPELGNLRALAQHMGIERTVIFVGRVPHSAVESYYELIDVLIYPRVSKRITELVTPLKPLEAMAKGKLVVASDVGGHREMIFPPRNGRLFTAGDPASLARACLDLLRHPRDWSDLERNALEYVSQSRSWDRNVGVYSELYGELLQARRSGRPTHVAHLSRI